MKVARLTTILIFVFTLLFGVVGNALEGPSEKVIVPADKIVGLINNMYIVVFNDTEGGCWDGELDVKNRIRYRLESSGIAVSKEEYFINFPSNPTLVFSVLGVDTKSGICAASYSLELFVDEYTEYNANDGNIPIGIYSRPRIWGRNGIVTRRGNINGMINNAVNSLLDELLSDVIAARRDSSVQAARYLFFDNISPITKSDYERYRGRSRGE